MLTLPKSTFLKTYYLPNSPNSELSTLLTSLYWKEPCSQHMCPNHMPTVQWGIETTYAKDLIPWHRKQEGRGEQGKRWLRDLPTIISFVFKFSLFKLSLSLHLFIQEVIKPYLVNFIVALTCKQGTYCTSYWFLSQTSQGAQSPLMALWSLSLGIVTF